MYILIFLISLLVFLKTLGYAIYEIRENANKLGGIATIVLSTIALFLPTIMYIIR